MVQHEETLCTWVCGRKQSDMGSMNQALGGFNWITFAIFTSKGSGRGSEGCDVMKQVRW